MLSIKKRGFQAVSSDCLMAANEVAYYLLESCKTLSNFESYMFGSTLTGIGNDIDILIVGPIGSPLIKLKKELKAASKNLPLDILYMLPSEERETDFINRTGCISLDKLSFNKALL